MKAVITVVLAMFLIPAANAAPPDTPIGFRPIGDDVSNGNYLILGVDSVTDPDGDPVTYEFELWDETKTTLLFADSLVSGNVSSAHTGYPGGFLGAWRARALAGGEYSAWSPWYEFRVSPGLAVDKIGGDLGTPPNLDYIICDDTTVVIEIKRWNYTGSSFYGVTHGFEIYSPDGATWEPVSGEWVYEVAIDYDGGSFVNSFSATGSGADTIGFGAFVLFSDGYVDEQQEVAYLIYTSVSCDDIGKTICIDTAFYPPAGQWLTSLKNGGLFSPNWSGPHCFEISHCCLGLRGNVNGVSGAAGDIDVNDLSFLVAYLFTGGEAPPCQDEGNVDGEGAGGAIHVSDLVYLVDYLFRGGPPPASCAS